MISFRKDVTLREIEAAYVDAGLDSVLQIPYSLQYGGAVGIPSALMQYVATWSRFHTQPSLKLSSGDSVESFVQEPHGLVSAYFSTSVRGSDSTIPLSKREALSFSVSRVQAMQEGQFRETMRGRGVFLCCFSQAKNEYLFPFYSRPYPGGLRSRGDFVSLTSRIINACAPSAERILTAQDNTAIGTLIYELFKNTDEHATVDEEGKPYTWNVRALIAKFIPYDSNSYSKQNVSDDPLFSKYLEKKSLRAVAEGASSQKISFLELTVLDTGPGLARRWMSRETDFSAEELSIDAEVEMIKRCFTLHATTKDTNASGGGLTHVLKTLRELNAFLRLRTGRVCLVQDFTDTDTAVFEPEHWLESQKELSYAVGASYSIVIPLKAEK